MSTVYLNGEFLPIDQAKVSVLERGFLFGDGVYEVIPAYGGNFLRLDEHLQRLQNSLDAVDIKNPLSLDEWLEILHELLEKNDGVNQSVYLQVSRGAAKVRDHSFSSDLKPTVFIMVNAIKPVSKETLAQGIRAITLDDIRWKACNIKATALLANVLLRQQATNEGAAEAILIRDGSATEGAASNVFIVKDGVIITPPISPMLLPGITRDLILELAEKNSIPFEERSISEAELRAASEIWMTSSTKEIMPVIELDGQPVGNAKFGPIWESMIEIYQAYKARLRTGEVQ